MNREKGEQFSAIYLIKGREGEGPEPLIYLEIRERESRIWVNHLIFGRGRVKKNVLAIMPWGSMFPNWILDQKPHPSSGKKFFY